ncbi:HD-GYP domain-containing protein [Alkalihalobacillus sp. BA299]|uniref:HD-GYP domain-containing protein n=1 Tax=Alkalihalobacillus sp. BA299 TaxID=2815938 RepID=UPI001ADA6A41|nr:HD-GYP domain-containing protein [Alkalihalobacillus sp. BA299]
MYYKPIEVVSLKGITVSLLASGDGTEVIHHHIQKGSQWYLNPEEGWTALECFYILKGELSWSSPKGEKSLTAGMTFSAEPIKQPVAFKAVIDTEFMYVSSQPVFQYYSYAINDKKNLAVLVEEKDGYTADHCYRIKDYSLMIAEEINLPQEKMYILNLGSFLHDIGKVKVPDSILNKPGKLTEEEFEIIKRHTIYGYELLKESELPDLRKAAFIPLEHHERFDGKGYPYGLKGDQISIEAAIVSVVDAFDAMTTDRIYRKALTKREAFAEIIRNRGKMFHPLVVDAFIKLIK